MELSSTSASLNSYASFSVIPRYTTSRTQSLSFFPPRNSHPKSPLSASTSNKVKPVGFLPLHTSRYWQLSHTATTYSSIAVPHKSVGEVNPTTEQSNPVVDVEATGNTFEEDKNSTDEISNEQKMIRVCDKLIDVFLVDKPTPTDWRKLLAFSKEWDNIRPHFYNRCQVRADNENDTGKKLSLLWLARKLKEVDEDIQRHNALLKVIRNSPSEINEIVTKRRKDFTKEFFVHLYTVAESYFDNPTEKNAVAELGNMCLAAVQTYDSATENTEALHAAELKFQDIINSPSLDVARKKIDDLAAKNQLDSELVLKITKAWSAAKDTDMTKDEVKDTLYYLYMKGIGNLQRLITKEMRILKYLLTIEDPLERLSALNDAFTPGKQIKGEDVDCLYTTPQKLYSLITRVVDAYHSSKVGTSLREARDLMNPKIIQKLEELKKVVQDKFL